MVRHLPQPCLALNSRLRMLFMTTCRGLQANQRRVARVSKQIEREMSVLLQGDQVRIHTRTLAVIAQPRLRDAGSSYHPP